MTTPPVALTIAGSDSGGGAGIQADLVTMAALGVHGTSVITVVTAQNTVGVQALYPLTVEVVQAQLQSLLADLPPDAVKCGLLGTPELVGLVADTVARGLLPRPVVDPVLVATSGDRLTTGATEAIVSAYVEQLLPRTALLTPNPEEAAALLGGGAVDSVEDRRRAARELLALGPDAVVITGGPTDVGSGGTPAGAADGTPDGTLHCVDVYADRDGPRDWTAPAVSTRNDHGTGCTYSAAVAAALARGSELRAACASAGDLVRRQLGASRDWRLGGGHGPVSHLHHDPAVY